MTTTTEGKITPFYADAIDNRTGFVGQMTDDFQGRLAAAHGVLQREDCDFYHTMDFGSGDVVPGAWDLRGGERSYLGFLDLAGRRVLEFGPATGHLSFWMDREGADVVVFDLAPGLSQDIIPQAGHDLEAQRRLSIAYAQRVRNGWWYSRRTLGSRARAVYGDIYALPSDVGRFDVSTFGCTLMHLAKPFFALQQAASVTDKAIVVTEPIARIPADLETPALEFVPVDTSKTVVLWWLHTPGAIIRMLKVLGFFEISLYYHSQKHHPFHELDKPAVEHLFFTVVGQRYKDMVPTRARSVAEVAAEEDVKRRWAPAPAGPTPDAEAARLREEIASLHSSLSWRLSRPVRVAGGLLRRLGLKR